MPTLLLLRHAKSSWKKPELADHDRPLNKRGKRDAPRVGRLLVTERLRPDVIACSTAVRAKRTAELVAAAAECHATMVFTEDLYLADPRTMLDILRSVADDADTVMLVGHNPGMESLLSRLTGCYEVLPTASLGHLELDIAGWSEINGNTTARLVKVYRPRDLQD